MSDKNKLIAEAMLGYIVAGIEAEKIINDVLGDGAVAKLAAEIYEVYEEELNDKKVANN